MGTIHLLLIIKRHWSSSAEALQLIMGEILETTVEYGMTKLIKISKRPSEEFVVLQKGRYEPI